MKTTMMKKIIKVFLVALCLPQLSAFQIRVVTHGINTRGIIAPQQCKGRGGTSSSLSVVEPLADGAVFCCPCRKSAAAARLDNDWRILRHHRECDFDCFFSLLKKPHVPDSEKRGTSDSVLLHHGWID